jgi:hypothetical protein
MYQSWGLIGIGTTTPKQTLDVAGNVSSSGTLISTVRTGTAPLAVSSTTQVKNLNASLLGGLPASFFQPVVVAHGVREFLASGSFTVPGYIMQLMVEMWGGGGGGASSCGGTLFAGLVGAGGSGAYTRDVIAVVPGATYKIVVGAGGAVGGNGGDSQIVDQSSNVLTFAGGGYGGTAAVNAAGGKADPKAAISHSGYATNGTGNGGGPPAENLAPDYDLEYYFGQGGSCVPPPTPGSPGYVLLGW